MQLPPSTSGSRKEKVKKQTNSEESLPPGPLLAAGPHIHTLSTGFVGTASIGCMHAAQFDYDLPTIPQAALVSHPFASCGRCAIPIDPLARVLADLCSPPSHMVSKDAES